MTLSATAIGGFSTLIAIQVTGLADGVSISPTNISLTPGTPQQVTFSVAPNAATASQTLTFTGTSGSLTHTTQLNLSITGTSSGLPTRTRYVRTDATTEYFQWLNQNWILYDGGTARYFLTDPSSNQVIVIDAASATLVYLPPITQFPLAGSTLAQGIYNRFADLYYFTDTNKIQVFSRAQSEWLSPISVSGAQRLWGIALSPDGSKMAISDLDAGNIYVLSPPTPGSIATFHVGSSSPFVVNPCGLAISDAGNVYYMVVVLGQGGGADQFFKLNTATGAIFNYGVDSPGLGANDAYLRNAISSDNSRVFFNDLGYIFYVDTATDTMIPANIDLPCCYLGYGSYDMALSSNQDHFEATGYFYDFNLNAASFYSMNDREILNIAYVYGTKLRADGRLFFQPSTNGIDIFDGGLGTLLHRVSLSVALSPNYDALVDDGNDNVLVAITGTGNGIAIVDLSSITEPAPLPTVRGRRGSIPVPTTDQSRLRSGGHSNARQTQAPSRLNTVRHVTRPLLR